MCLQNTHLELFTDSNQINAHKVYVQNIPNLSFLAVFSDWPYIKTGQYVLRLDVLYEYRLIQSYLNRDSYHAIICVLLNII